MLKKVFDRYKSLSENNKIVLKNVIGAFGVKGLSLLVSLFTMPAYISFFNDQAALGLWFTVLSVLNWILNFDLGIGNGLRNNLTRTLTQKDELETKRYLSSAYISVGVLCVIISTVFVFAFNFINWNLVFNIKENIVSRDALLLSVKIVFVGIMLQLFFKLITSVLYALQKSSVNNFVTLCSTVISLICVLVLPSYDNDTNMVVMAIIHVVAVILPLVVATVIVFCGKTLRKCIPSIKFFTKKHTKDVLTLGGMFLFVQIAYMVIMSTNEYAITIFTSNEAVVDYQVYQRLFTLGSTVFSLALTPIWSAVTKALAEKNYKWINSLYKRLMLLAGLGVVAEFLLVPFLQIFVNLWLGEKAITVNYIYGFAFAALGGLMIMNAALSSIANGVGELKTQALFFGSGAILKLPMAWLLVQLTGSWIGVVWANVIAMSAYCLIQPLWLKKYLDKKKKEVSEDVTIQG